MPKVKCIDMNECVWSGCTNTGEHEVSRWMKLCENHYAQLQEDAFKRIPFGCKHHVKEVDAPIEPEPEN